MPRVYVAPISFGLGDLVVSLPAIQALAGPASGRDNAVWLVARSDSQVALTDRIDGLAGWVAEDQFETDPTDGRFVDLRDHPLQRDHWWGSPEFDRTFGPLSINDILSRICADFGIAADFAAPRPLRSQPRAAVEDTVLFVTESDGPAKRWPAARWRGLADAVREAGSDVLLVTRDEVAPDLAGLGIEAIQAPTPGDAVDVLSSCRAVVGVDTGLTHIAAQQATPTVTITREPAVFFRPWAHTRAVLGTRCVDECLVDEERQRHHATVRRPGVGWRSRSCPAGAPCMSSITVARVTEALQELW
jgi:Glycosyltransferase family 9 (heptosyltransferase)